MQLMIAWIVSLILTASPLNQPTSYPEARETESEKSARYNEIAQDLLAVTYDPEEAPLFKGSDSRAKTSALLLSIASFESHFRKDVDLGVGAHAKGDHGKSWCLMQIQLGNADQKGHTPTRIVLTPTGGYEWAYTLDKGLGGEDLVRNRKDCFRAGLHMVRVSFQACRDLPLEQKLRLYASGNCEDGGRQSELRVNRAMSWYRRFSPPVPDKEVNLALPWTRQEERSYLSDTSHL